FIASTTYYVQQYGTHAIKVGTDIEKNQFGSLNFVTGTPPNASFCSESLGYDPGSVCGAVFQTRNGAPFRVVVSNRNPEETVHSSNRAFYAQDEWRPNSKVTARVGLRYEVTTFEPAGHQSVPDFRLWQPRIGVAYDLFDNAQSVVHGFAGRIMDDNALTLPSFLSPLGTLTTTFQLNAAGVYVPRAQSGGPSGNQVDPTLHPTSSDEYSIGFTQRVFRNTNLDLTVVSRKSHDMFEDTCVNQQDCPFFWLTNRPNNDPNALRSDYHGAILKLESRPFSWLSGLVSYTYSKSRGSVEYDQNSGADFDIFPDHFVNRYGYLSDDARHRVKINGYAHAPYGITIGVNANWDSGVPYNVTTPAPSYSVEFLERRGSRRVPSFRQVDLQVQKDFQLGFVRAGLVAAVSNVLNTEIALTADGNAGSGGTVASPTNPNFGLATSWQRPRRYDLGVRFEF
ncbi:MAG: TonB-dependent receptor, partial [Acidobacteriota bacterium]